MPLAGSTRSLDANQDRFAPDALFNPAQVSFTPDGSQLVVSHQGRPGRRRSSPASRRPVPAACSCSASPDGRPSAQFVHTDFDNRGPFGFSFDRRGNLLVALFVGGGVEDQRTRRSPARPARTGSTPTAR